VIDALAFVEKEVVLADGRTVGDGLAADPWIRERLLAPILAVDEAGLPRFRLAYVELPRGHWKSGGIAAIATAEAATAAPSATSVFVLMPAFLCRHSRSMPMIAPKVRAIARRRMAVASGITPDHFTVIYGTLNRNPLGYIWNPSTFLRMIATLSRW